MSIMFTHPTLIWLPLIAISGYLLCAILLWRRSLSAGRANTRAILLLLVIGLVFHGAALYTAPGLNALLLTELGPALSLAGLVSVFFYLIAWLRKTSATLGLIVLPVAILSVIAAMLLDATAGEQTIAQTGWHIALAIPTYGVFCLAFAQACLLIIQEKQLQHPARNHALSRLPALQSMEKSLFWLILCGFVLMTLNLLLGMVSSMMRYGSLLEFNHHIIFSIAAWAGFGCLLAGGKIAGWRGEIAARWTIGAFAMLLLAYFGTRVVQDVILAV